MLNELYRILSLEFAVDDFALEPSQTLTKVGLSAFQLEALPLVLEQHTGVRIEYYELSPSDTLRTIANLLETKVMGPSSPPSPAGLRDTNAREAGASRMSQFWHDRLRKNKTCSAEDDYSGRRSSARVMDGVTMANNPDALNEARRQLLARLNDPRIMGAGPVVLGRELILQSVDERSTAECRALLVAASEVLEYGTRHPDRDEYPFGFPDEAVADALMWAGIGRGLINDLTVASRHLEAAYNGWERIGKALKSGRCAEENAEVHRLLGSPSEVWFTRAETSFRNARRMERVRMVQEARSGGARKSSDFLLRSAVVSDPSSTVLGSSTAAETRERVARAAT